MSKELPEADLPEEGEMSFLEHLEVLRWHLIRSAAAIFIVAIAAFIAKGFIFDTLLLGPKNPDFWTYRMLCELSEKFNLSDLLCITEIPFDLINISMAGQFSTHIFVSIIAGVVVAFPYIIFEMWRFIKPGLYNKERKYASGMVFYTSVLFIMGVLFGYYIIAPLSVNFLGSYRVSEAIHNQIDLNSYFSTIATLVLASGGVFELPVLIYFLTKIGLVTPELLRQYRRHAVVGILILAAVITPPDVSSQILVFVPLMLLYEVSIWVSAIVLRNEAKANTDI
ncbi:MAG: twin-arginine translocase subunit TatC [Flavobacteriales bacterium]|nr:twin-arginine translocase subunit TatC [Flavobacteriales bacterium]